MRSDEPIQVLIIHDTPLLWRVLAKEVERHGGIRVVAQAADAVQVREQMLRFHPDVVVLDLELTSGDGLNLLRRLREHYPVPVIACDGTTPRAAPRALRGVQWGALDVMAKPGGLACGALRPWAAELAARIRTAAHEAQPLPVTCPTARLRPPTFRATGLNPARFLVAIGASTGGPEAVQKLLTSTAADFPPVVIVQHMPAGFTRSFAERLNDSCPLRVTEAHDSDVLTPGRVVVARGDTHLIVRRAAKGWRAYYTRQQLVNGHCPSVNVLFESVAVAAGRQAVGILLTGMGADGAQGLLQLRQQGALTIAQDRDSSVVYGMPKVGVELGAALYSARPERIPALVQRALLARDGKVADAGVRVRS